MNVHNVNTDLHSFPPRELADSKHLPLFMSWRATAKAIGFDLDRLSMNDLYSLHQGLSAVSYMVTAMLNQPCLTPDEDTDDRAGNMLNKFLDQINSTLSAIHTTAGARTVDNDNDAQRKMYLLSQLYLDGLSDIDAALAEVVRFAVHIREPLEA